VPQCPIAGDANVTITQPGHVDVVHEVMDVL